MDTDKEREKKLKGNTTISVWEEREDDWLAWGIKCEEFK